MRIISIIISLLIAGFKLVAQPCVKPFPQHVIYAAGSIKPNHVSQKQLDNTVQAFYIQWKSTYIKSTCTPNQSYVWVALKHKNQCVSEGQGYGMVITALMAGYDKDARHTFDNLYRYYKAHPTKPGQHLMAWAQNSACKNTDKSAATDGDMDIAYGLLLADKQWGSKGEVNYMAAAKLLLTDIMHFEVNQSSYTLLLANGIDNDGDDYFDTRPSDFMPANLRAYKNATHDARWGKIVSNTYSLFTGMQNKYSPKTGLIPDFIQHINNKPKPARPHYLESGFDGDYNYNACRVPWRAGTDYLLTGDKRAKQLCNRMNSWLRQTTKNKPAGIASGYKLNGAVLPDADYPSLCFIGPFTVSAMVDSSNQQWLNHLWDYLNRFKMKEFGYYDNTIKMLNLIVISGNYWSV